MNLAGAGGGGGVGGDGGRRDEPDWAPRATCPAREPRTVLPARPCAAAAAANGL